MLRLFIVYSGNKYTDAEKWCGMSMRMLKYLDAFKNNYEEHVSLFCFFDLHFMIEFF